METVEWKIRAELFRRFVDTGRSASIAELADGLSLEADTVRGALRGLQEQHLIALDATTDEPWMLHPFSAVPTNYEVESAGITYFANCAWDALSIPSLIDRPSTLRVPWTDTGEPVQIQIDGNGPHPEEGFVRFAVPPRDFWDDIGRS